MSRIQISKEQKQLKLRSNLLLITYLLVLLISATSIFYNIILTKQYNTLRDSVLESESLLQLQMDLGKELY